jgi:hypothetical protein
MINVEDFELPDGRKARFTERALENADDHDDCPFCMGRVAAHRADGENRNPYTDVPAGPMQYYDTPLRQRHFTAPLAWNQTVGVL